jgi:hypothetical protein
MAAAIAELAPYLSLMLAGVGGWIATHLIGKPFLTYRDLRAEIARCLILYANVPCPSTVEFSPPARTVEARTKYRELASQLYAVGNTIPLYGMWARVSVMPAWNELEEARGNLIGLSNSVGEPNQGLEISRRQDNIRRLLKIK